MFGLVMIAICTVGVVFFLIVIKGLLGDMRRQRRK
jgi:hypothetical protein